MTNPTLRQPLNRARQSFAKRKSHGAIIPFTFTVICAITFAFFAAPNVRGVPRHESASRKGNNGEDALQRAQEWYDAGKTLKALQAIQKAVRLEKDNPDSLQSGRLTQIWRTYGKICDAQMASRDATRCYAEALRCEKMRFGDLKVEHLPEILQLIDHPGCAPENRLQHLQEALAIANKSANPPAEIVRSVKLKLAAALKHRRQQGDGILALSLLQDVLEPQDPEVLELSIVASNDYRSKHQYNEALELLEKAKGKDDAALIPLVKEMAKNVKDPAEKRKVLERLLSLTEKTQGANHIDAATSLFDLAQLNKKDQPAAAQGQFQRAAQVFSNQPQPDWDNAFLSWKMAGDELVFMNQRNEAATNYYQALSVFKNHNAGNLAQIVDLHQALVNEVLVPMNRFQEAEVLCKDVLARAPQNLTPVLYTNVVATYVGVLRKQGKTAAADKLLKDEKVYVAELESNRVSAYPQPSHQRSGPDIWHRVPVPQPESPDRTMIEQRDRELRRIEQFYNEKILRETDPHTVAILMRDKVTVMEAIRDKWNRKSGLSN